ncbi:MAG: ABC transporter ATP-binding protein/permease [Rubripirellula sp.]|nr:ABC transporter ATP-binding protein/permease [Rubripirellula sp.]
MVREPSRKRFMEFRLRARKKKTGNSAHSFHGHSGKNSKKIGSRDRKFLELFLQFLQLLQGHRRNLSLALALLTIGIGLRLIPPLGTKLAIDLALTSPPKEVPTWASGIITTNDPLAILVVIATGVVVVTATATVVHLTSRWIATKTVNLTQISIRKKVFAHSIHLPMNLVHDLKSGGAASLIREDAGGVADLIFSMLYNPWRALVQLAGSLLILMLVDWKLMLGGATLLPLVWISHRTWINRIRPLYRDIRKQRQTIDSGVTETFGGIRVVRTFARQRSETRRFVEEGNLLVRQQLFTWWWTRLIETVWEVVIPLASTGLLLYGGYQIIEGELTLGDLMMFLVYLTMLLDPLATLAASAAGFQNNLAGLDRILDVLEIDQELPSTPNAIQVSKVSTKGRIQLENIDFAYPGSEQKVLRNISFTIEPGETVALVGRSGAGKTTLTNIIARFYDPSAGKVLLDGTDLKDIELSSFRQLLGIVEQDVFLFDGTIAENIGYSRKDADIHTIQQAATMAAAHDFIQRLPKGYLSRIGERGVKLSGGQRQRIAIARAICADPKILILDEATSNLDSESEQLIQQSLQSLLKNRTSLVIAHRLSTIQQADRIVVLDDGKIIESGNHPTLLRQGGIYSEMIQRQTTYSSKNLNLPRDS